MNGKQLIVVWILCVWLAFSVLYVSYEPAGESESGGYYPASFALTPGARWSLMPMVIPAILLAIPLYFSFRGKER